MANKRTHIDYEKLMYKNHNKGLIILMLVILAGYLFFFLSPLLFHERPTKELSPLNRDIAFMSGKVRINSCKYSRSQQVIEICCTTYGINPEDIEIGASCNFDYKTKGSKALPAAIGYQQSDYFVAYVLDIPEDWYCISLRAVPKANGTVNNSNDNSQNYGYLFTCVEDIETVSNIENNKTKNQYIIERDERRIAYDEELIESNNKSIENYKAQIEDWESDIAEIEQERPFKIASERQKSDAEIVKLKSSIQSYKKNIDTLEQNNKSLTKEIQEYKSVIRKLQNHE